MYMEGSLMKAMVNCCPPQWGLVSGGETAMMTSLFGAAFSVPCVKRPDLLSGLSLFSGRLPD